MQKRDRTVLHPLLSTKFAHFLHLLLFLLLLLPLFTLPWTSVLPPLWPRRVPATVLSPWLGQQSRGSGATASCWCPQRRDDCSSPGVVPPDGVWIYGVVITGEVGAINVGSRSLSVLPSW